MRSAIARTITPSPTRIAPPTPVEAQSRIPPTIRSAAGISPIRKTNPPIATLPVICSPQRCRNSEADRFSVSNGPVPSRAMTGTARNVISDQPSCRNRPKIAPAIPPLSSRKPMIVAITVETSAQPAILPNRLRATAVPSLNRASRPWKIMSAQAASPTLK